MKIEIPIDAMAILVAVAKFWLREHGICYCARIDQQCFTCKVVSALKETGRWSDDSIEAREIRKMPPLPAAADDSACGGER
jgi:hypothetical protein